MAKKEMNVLDWVAYVLLVIGGLNWGLAIWDINLVTVLLGTIPALVNVVYGLVGLAAIYSVVRLVSKK